MLAALCWVPRSSLLDRPMIHELSQEEKAMLEAANAQDQPPVLLPPAQQEDDADAQDEHDMDLALTQTQLQDLALNRDDLEMGSNNDSDLGSDVEDHRLKASDKVLVTASVEDEHASLEMHVYDDETGSLYVHHDIALPAYPLCVEFVGCDGPKYGWSESSRAYVAVGTFEPDIEIWTLDVLDALEPNTVLKGHTDAVMALAWNERFPSLLASGSADRSVVVWDLETSQAAKTFAHHKDKVQVVAWNPAESSVLLSGSFDHTVCVWDARAAPKVATHATRGSDVEDAAWDLHNPAVFAVATEDGYVSMYDVRKLKGALLAWTAHSKPCAAVCSNAYAPGIWATASVDKTVRLWDLQSGSPVCISSKSAAVGKLFACEFAREPGEQDALLLAVGGSKGLVALWHPQQDDPALTQQHLPPGRIHPSPVSWPLPATSA